MIRSIVVLHVVLFYLVQSQFPCNSLVAADGSTYDLTRLAALGVITGTDSSALWTYSVSVCGNRVSCGTGVTTGYCQYGVIGGRQYFFNVGYLDQTIAHEDGGGVELIYFEPNQQRSGRVFISCNPNALISNINAITPANPLDYEFHFSSLAGCSTVPPCYAYTPKLSYDLRAFIGTSPITVSDNMGQYQYSVSVCANNIPNCNLCSSAGYCQTSLQGQKACVGRFQNITANEDGTGVVLYYSEPQEGRKGKVFITCNPRANLVSNLTAISPTDPEDYSFYFNSYAACPGRPPCKATAPDGSKYNLDALVGYQGLWGADYFNRYNYTVSICSNILKCAQCSEAGYCQKYFLGDDEWCIGTYYSIEGLNSGQGVKLTYKEPGGLERIGTVTITCNPNGPLVNDITVKSAYLQYEFNFTSNAACSNIIIDEDNILLIDDDNIIDEKMIDIE